MHTADDGRRSGRIVLDPGDGARDGVPISLQYGRDGRYKFLRHRCQSASKYCLAITNRWASSPVIT